MSNTPLVSIIMNCYNSEAYLRESLDTVIAQTYQNYEVIFWDNQSTDKSAEIFKSYKDTRFKYFLAPNFTPLGQARNLAIEKSQGDLIAFLDCDDLWTPDKLELCVPEFKNPKVGIVISDTYFFNEKKERILYGENPPPTGQVFKQLLSRYYISLETVVVRRKALESLSENFDPRFNMIEEMDLFIRIAYDWELAYVPKALSKWRVHQKSWTFQKMEMFPIERRQFLEKMEQLYPNFKANYLPEYEAVESLIAFEKANLEWRKGNYGDARSIIKPFATKSLKMKIYYYFMFLSPKVFDFFNSFRSVGI